MKRAALLLLLCAACNGSSPAPPLRITTNAGGIVSMKYRGEELLTGCGYYMIASCSGADVHSVTTTSCGNSRVTGPMMGVPSTCAGSPFSIRTQRIAPNAFKVTTTLGPVTASYATLSLPMDLRKALFPNFGFDGSGYKDGCDNTWKTHAGTGGAYHQIRTPCVIPDHGPVGLAETLSPVPRFFAQSPRLKVTRAPTAATTAQFVNHPGTNGLEIPFGARSPGEMIMLEELIVIEGP